MPKIVYFYPKPRTNRNYSIPALFSAVQENLPEKLSSEAITVSKRSNGFWKRVLIAWEAREKQGDINHITGDIHFITCLLKRRRTVLTIHDCGFMQHPSPIARIIFKWFWLKLPVCYSAAVSVVSEVTKNEVIKYVQCHPDKIKVVYNFVSGNFTCCPKDFNLQKPTILHIGTAPNKNLERLIKAIAVIPCQLHIIGKLSRVQLRLLVEYNIDYINNTNLGEEEVLQAYRECDLLCFISTLEGFGLPILEAQAVGRPVITSNLSAMPEVAGDGAYFTDPFNVDSIRQAITTVSSDAALRNKLIERGYENAKRFSLDKTVAGYSQIYFDIWNRR
ncbi:MAG TPA: glycosyltransferase family 1 protein [Flavisolibacter sp.]|nr:glycosyltransferase family 1 protein [Flavisolibacter sp.]